MANPLLQIALKSVLGMLGDFRIEIDEPQGKVRIYQEAQVAEFTYEEFAKKIAGLFPQQ